MRDKLTLERIRRAECPAGKKQHFIFDTEAPRLALRVTATGAKSFIFEAKLHRQTIRMTIGDVHAWPLENVWGKDDDGKRVEVQRGAREEAKRLEGLVDQGIDPRLQKQEQITEQATKREQATRREITLADVWPLYIDANKHRWSERHLIDHERFTKQGGVKAKRGAARTCPGPLWPLMGKKLSELTAEVVKAWATTESAHRATQCRNAFGALRACLNWCSDLPEYKELVNPDACSSRVKRAAIPPKKAKADCLQKEQLPYWFGAVRQIRNPVISAYLQALLLTGARREELAPLKWSDVDFKWRSMVIKDKVAGQRVIPLTPFVASLLAPLPRRNEFVFSSLSSVSGRLQEPRHPHNKAMLVAGIEGLTIHGLRRSFGTLSEWVEVPAGVVAQIMGHKPSATAEKHYKQRPLDLLRMWHVRVEAWIIEKAGLEQPAEDVPAEVISLDKRRRAAS